MLSKALGCETPQFEVERLTGLSWHALRVDFPLQEQMDIDMPMCGGSRMNSSIMETGEHGPHHHHQQQGQQQQQLHPHHHPPPPQLIMRNPHAPR